MRDLLRQWKPQLPLPPRFHEEVWLRLERREKASRRGIDLRTLWIMWLGTWLPRPAFATAYLLLLLAFGGGLGWVHAREASSRVIGELSALYVQSADPYQSAP